LVGGSSLPLLFTTNAKILYRVRYVNAGTTAYM